MAESGAEWYHEFKGAGDAKDDAYPAPVVLLIRPVAGILQCLTCNNESQKL